MAEADPLFDHYRFSRYVARRGKAQLRNRDDVYRDEQVPHYGELIRGWPLPFFVVDQLGDIASNPKRRRTQGVKYYVGGAKVAEEEFRR
eukprot:9786936-Alexandrium_andersonii.AAC.1